jgi:predicted DNA-binding transcriptional regulator AlpA
MTNLSHLPNELGRARILTSGQAAEFWGVSLSHWRRLYRARKVPTPIKIGDRKLGWPLNALIKGLESRTEPPHDQP